MKWNIYDILQNNYSINVSQRQYFSMKKMGYVATFYIRMMLNFTLYYYTVITSYSIHYTKLYEMLYEHKVQHEEMMTKAERMLEQFSNNEIKIFKLLPFIAHNMILLHTIEEDMKYFPYLNHRAK